MRDECKEPPVEDGSYSSRVYVPMIFVQVLQNQLSIYISSKKSYKLFWKTNLYFVLKYKYQIFLLSIDSNFLILVIFLSFFSLVFIFYINITWIMILMELWYFWTTIPNYYNFYILMVIIVLERNGENKNKQSSDSFQCNNKLNILPSYLKWKLNNHN